MKKGDRYDVAGLVEAQFEPGSRRRVLRNKLGIKSSREMDVAEANALTQAMEAFVGKYDEHHRFTADDICEMHRRWHQPGALPLAKAERRQNNAGPDTSTGRRYLESPENGWRFFLFVRERQAATYCAIGPATKVHIEGSADVAALEARSGAADGVVPLVQRA